VARSRGHRGAINAALAGAAASAAGLRSKGDGGADTSVYAYDVEQRFANGAYPSIVDYQITGLPASTYKVEFFSVSKTPAAQPSSSTTIGIPNRQISTPTLFGLGETRFGVLAVVVNRLLMTL